MVDTTPSKIPVSIHKHIPTSLSNSALNSHSPTSLPSPSINKRGRASPVPIVGVGGRRLSLIDGSDQGNGTNGTKSRHISLRGSVTLGDDPAHLKLHILSLKLALESAEKKLFDVEAGPGSMVPQLPNGSPVTPFKVSLIEEDDENDGRVSPNEFEPSPTGNETRPSSRPSSRGLPHSSGILDLKSRATSTPNDGRTRIPQPTGSYQTALHPTSPFSPFTPSRATSPLTENRSLRSPCFFDSGGSRSPDRRILSPGTTASPGTPAGRKASGKVIDSLQAEKLDLRTQLERAQADHRAGRRRVEQLARQNEDLKETKERMKVENEGLNNVIARKERLLQETLQRARTAESSLATLQSTQKSLETSTKFQLSTMSAQVFDAEQIKLKAEREATALRESVKSLRDVWARELKSVRSDMKRSEDRETKEREEAARTHMALIELVKSQSANRTKVQDLVKDALQKSDDVAAVFSERVGVLRSELEKSEKENDNMREQVAELAGDLQRLRRLAQEPPREDLNEAAKLPSRKLPSTSPRKQPHSAAQGKSLEAELEKFPIPP